jgi:methylenetetrahydrofolate reductase (NADPH)
MKSGSNLERVLLSGEFAVTVEIGPPMGADGGVIRNRAKMLRGFADAYNITDNQKADARLSSIAASFMLLEEKVEPVMQMTCRDRNRIAMQSDILGAAALGIKNCLVISGDHQAISASGKLHGHPHAKGVYDVDSIQLVNIIKRMRDESVLEGGDPIDPPPKMFIGAAWTPGGEPLDFRPVNLKKKVDAGADFIQTQGIYDVEMFKNQMKAAGDLGVLERTAVLAGIIIPKNLGMLKYMNENVPGVRVPDELMRRMKSAKDAAAGDKEKEKEIQRSEGIKITAELIARVREIPGVRGVHLQAIGWEKYVPEIVKAAGLLPRPQILQV